MNHKNEFECKLFDYYGLAERVMLAIECSAHKGHHVNMDLGITEIITKDNQPAAPGDMSRIVATGLHNYGMPLIRYQTSDITNSRSVNIRAGASKVIYWSRRMAYASMDR